MLEEHVFRVYDDNHDGYVDFVEFMAIFYIMSEKPPEEIMTKIFQMFDINQDGIITQEKSIFFKNYKYLQKYLSTPPIYLKILHSPLIAS